MARTEKLRMFLSAHPPLVVFIFCVGMTAVAFVSFAYYIKFNNIKNVDIQRDWNTILYNATKVNFCSTSNVTTDFLQQNSSLLQELRYINVSLDLDVAFHLPKGFRRDNPVLELVSSFNSSVLGYQEHLNTRINLKFSFSKPLFLHCKGSNGCIISETACVTITAPHSFFPPLKPRPTSCSLAANDTFHPLTFSATLNGDPTNDCSSVLMKISHEEEEQLFVYLTVETKSLVHEHLMRSSYFLFIVILVILLFGFFRGAHQHHDRKSTVGYLLT